MTTLPIHSVLKPSFQASKWLKCPVLIDVSEMQDLLSILSHFWIVQTSGVILPGNEIVSTESFLEVYRLYIEKLKKGEQLEDSRLRPYFSSVFTTALEALYVFRMNKGFLVKVQLPVIQLQSHTFNYSFADQTFRSMVLGNETIQWGLQFSYPQIYQDEHFNVFSTIQEDKFPNYALYKNLQKWVRHHTIATPFEVGGKRKNVPIRIGRQCLSWINNHPQLQLKGLRVVI